MWPDRRAVKPRPALCEVACQPSNPVSQVSENPLGRRHVLQGISVWEFITMRPNLYLSHLFLPLWHWENCSQSLGGSLAFQHPIHHKSSLQRMDHFHACSPACLFTCLLLSSAGCCLRAPQSSPRACCNYPLRRHTSPWTLVDNFSPFCSGTSGIDCDGRWPVNAASVHLKHHV